MSVRCEVGGSMGVDGWFGGEGDGWRWKSSFSKMECSKTPIIKTKIPAHKTNQTVPIIAKTEFTPYAGDAS